MEAQTLQRILAKIDWNIKKQERFLGQVSRIRTMAPEDQARILKNACWVDGTLAGQVRYAQEKRQRLVKAYARLAGITTIHI